MRKHTPKIYLLVSLVLILGVVLSVLLYFFVDRSNYDRKEKLLTENFNNVENRIQNEIDLNLNALFSLRAYYLSKDGFTRDQFTNFSRFFTDNIKSIQALEWVPAVTLDERISFENSTRKEGFPDFEIFTRDSSGNVIRAEERPVYYPVHYIHPFEGNEAAFGFDPGKSLPMRQEAIDKANKTKAAAASTFLKIIQKENPHKAILVFIPVYVENQLHGLIEGVYILDKIIESSLEGIELEPQFGIKISSTNNPNERLFVQSWKNKATSLIKSTELEMADRSWDLQIIHLDNETTNSINPIWFFIASMIFTLLLVKLVYNTLTDNRQILIENLTELKQKNEDLEQYAYVASHDLQEPLHSLQSLVALIEDDYGDKFDKQGKQYLAFLHETSERMSLLIKNLLNYSRIGHMEDPELVNCNEVLKRVESEVAVLIKETGAEIIKENELPTVKGYPIAIQQLFQNLITNAIKFQPKDQKPQIKISSFLKINYPAFKFEDNGIGIPNKDRDKVFVIFKRLHNSSKYKGTGVGLANCKKIVDLHKGNIWLDSEEGKGSIFYFTLNPDK